MKRGVARWRLLAALVAIVSLIGGTGAAAQDTAEELRETREDLADARQQLATVEREVRSAKDELQLVDAQLVTLTAQLREAEAALAAAQAEYDEAAALADDATRRLQAETDRLQRITDELDAKELTFDLRVAAAYKYGSAGYLRAIVGAQTISDLIQQTYYVQSVMESERRIIDEIEDLAQTVNERRRDVDQLRDVLVREEAKAQRLRDAVAEVEADRRNVTQQMASERVRRQSVLNTLESTQSHYETLVAELQAESERLAEELRRSQWRAGAPGVGELAWPTDGRPGSGYGWRTHPIFGSRRFHSGVDIAGPTGQTIIAAAEGLVVHAGWRGGYGLAVVIDHGGGLATLYAHQSRIVVGEGSVVGKGQKIGEIGSTGYSTGPHLHYEVRVNGEPRDPMQWYQ